ncbi:MAG: polyprenyl synthetase family protein, partial [Candidatus Aenigmarchaeota archaeon]|nr:polyprenyl synthetase family protein [Candidatus Aenigmarchaeota archaeon]
MPDIMEYLNEKKPLIDYLIRKYLPTEFDQKYTEWAFGKPRYSYDTESLTKSLAEPVWDLLNRGGKRWRPGLFLLITEMLGGDPEKLIDFAAIPELIHNGTLMVDDVEDLGELRRGKPCTHKLFGQDVAINAGNFMYFIPLLSLKKKKGMFDDKTTIRAYEAYSEEMINVSLGQALDIWWHKGRVSGVTEEQYLQMCAYKTGTLARLAARLAVILSGGSAETESLLGRLAESLGVAFQIQDDVLSASQGEFSKKKGFGDDITEGKRSLPVIHCLNSAPEQDRKDLLDILDKHTRNPELIRRALDILSRNGCIEYARDFSRRLVEKAWKDAEPNLPDNPARETLESLMRFATER